MLGSERETVDHSTRGEHVDVAERDMQYASVDSKSTYLQATAPTV